MVAPLSDIGIRRTMTANTMNMANTRSEPSLIIPGSFSPSMFCILDERCESSICVFLFMAVASMSALKLVFDKVEIHSA